MRRLEPKECQPIWNAVEFAPAGPEQAGILYGTERFPLLVGGERGGKTTIAEKILLPHVLLLPKLQPETFLDDFGKPLPPRTSNPHFIIFGPSYAEPRREYEFLKDDLMKLGKLDPKKCFEPKGPQPWMLITTDNVVVQTRTTYDPEDIRAISPEGVVIAECGGVSIDAVNRIWGRIASTRGFIIFEGTLEDSNHWWREYLVEGERPNLKGTRTYSIPSWANRVVFPGGENDPEILAWKTRIGDDLFLERVAAKPAPPRMRVLKEFSKEFIQEMTIPAGARHELWIDPGYMTAYAVLFVAYWEEEGGKFFYIYDELYEQNKTTDTMIDLCKKKPTWFNVQNTRRGVIDIGARYHRDSTTSSLEIWKKRLPGFTFNMDLWREDRLIERVRHTFEINKIAIHPRVRGLIAEAGLGEKVFPEMHEWRYPVDNNHTVVSEKPIDKWNHSAKALGYGLLNVLGQVERKQKPSVSFNRLRGKKSTIKDPYD